MQKFYDIAFIPYFNKFDSSTFKDIGVKTNVDLLKHLSQIYSENPNYFIEKDTFAYINTNFKNMFGNEIFAYFELNGGGRQKWKLISSKTKQEIIDICQNPSKIQITLNFPKTRSEIDTQMDNTKFKGKLNPIIRNKVDEYQKLHCPNEKKYGVVFSRMVNQAILEYYDPGCLNNDESLLDAVCVDGSLDTGLDGICIKVNGKIVPSVKYLKSVIETDRNLINDVEIFFIQSKYKYEDDNSKEGSFNTADWSVFSDAIRNFLGDEGYIRTNPKVKNWFDIKNKITGDYIKYFSRSRIINIRIFYAACTKWNEKNHPDILGKLEMLKRDIEEREEVRGYIVTPTIFLDDDKLISYLKENAKYYEAKINTTGEIRLENSSNVDFEGIAVKLSVKDLLNILIDKETQLLRKDLFDENVRDYQGKTKVNENMKKTLKENPESFVIRNNGITILVSDAHKDGFADYTLKNPQIINGCQTCNVIYQIYKDNNDNLDTLEKAEIFAKIIKIKSHDYQVTTNVVSANNSQNVVYDLVDEISKEYHKKLEEFFEDYYSVDEKYRVYYERRSKSLQNHSNLLYYQKIKFKDLISSVISVWFDEPHKAKIHEAKLLGEYKNKIFQDTHQPTAYYVATLLSANYEKLIFDNVVDSQYRRYKFHICFIVSATMRLKYCNNYFTGITGDEKQIEVISKKFISSINNYKEFESIIKDSINKFKDACKNYIRDNGENYRYAIYDSEKFTKYLFQYLHNNIPQEQIKAKESTTNESWTGKVSFKGKDKNGELFIKIEMSDGNIIFAPQKANNNCNFNTLERDDDVIFILEQNKRSNNKNDYIAKRVHKPIRINI